MNGEFSPDLKGDSQFSQEGAFRVPWEAVAMGTLMSSMLLVGLLLL